MPAGSKEFPLSIVLRTVDRATAGLKRVNDRIKQSLAPVRKLNLGLRSMATEAGLPKLATGFSGVAREAGRLAFKIGAIAAAAGLTTRTLFSMIDAGDSLAKTADRLDISIDAYAQLRFAAGQAGVETAKLDVAMDGLSKRVGEAKAGTGSLVTFLKKASPALLKQLKGAKDNEEAFGLLADAMTKLEDPTKRTALANAAFGRSGAPLINLLKLGSEGVNELKAEYASLAGSQEESARASEKVKDAFGRVSAATSGVKAAIVSGLAPALLDISEMLKNFFVANRAAIAAWARDFGEKLPGRIKALMASLKGFIKAVKPVWDAIGGLRGAVVLLSVALGAKLVLALKTLGVAMLTTPFGLVLTAIAAIVAAGVHLVKNWDKVKEGFAFIWDAIKRGLSTFFDWVKKLLRFTPLRPIIDNWGPISGFFKKLWGGVKKVFAEAWDFIKDIIDKVSKGVDKVLAGARKVNRFVNPTASNLRDRLESIKERQDATQERLRRERAAEVKVRFENAPRGTRVDVEDTGGGVVDVTTGYQLEPGQ